MSISGVVSHYRNTGHIDRRYRAKAEKIDTLSGMAMDALDVYDRKITRDKEKQEVLDFAKIQGFNYDESSNSFIINGRIVEFETMEAVKPFLQAGIFDVNDFDNPLLAKSSGPDNIETTINGKPALINQEEKNLIDVAGKAGEDLVEETGSGEIDLETGRIKHQGGIGLATNYGAGSGFQLAGPSQFQQFSPTQATTQFQNATGGGGGGLGFQPQGSSLLGVAQNALMAVNPIAGLALMAGTEFLQAKNQAEANREKIDHLKEGIGAFEGKVGDIQDSMGNVQKDYIDFQSDTMEEVERSFEKSTDQVASVLDKIQDTQQSTIKKGKGLKTGDADIVVSNIQDNIVESNKKLIESTYANVDKTFKSSSKKLDDSLKQHGGQIEDLELAIKNQQYEIDTLSKSDHWTENIFGGIFS